jgi:predicted small lipoprotein YifL
LVIDLVARCFNRPQECLGSIKVVGIGHYNAIIMLKQSILGRVFSPSAVQGACVALAAVWLMSGCGQKGPLFLPSATAVQPSTAVQRTAPGAEMNEQEASTTIVPSR